YALALWSRFGDELVQVDADAGLDAVGLYGGRGPDGTARLLVVNPTGTAFGATIVADPTPALADATADEVRADSLTSTAVTGTGSGAPSPDLAEPSPLLPVQDDGSVRHDFPAFSITLIRWGPRSP